MLCCSSYCKYYTKCHHSVVNNPGVTDTVEPFDSFGYGSYTYNSDTKEVKTENHTMCQNYSMYGNGAKE